jgi:hypothetical protein
VKEVPRTLAHFEVEDVEAAVQDLEAKGVHFIDYDEGPLRTEGHIARNGPFLGAWFHDPDDNTPACVRCSRRRSTYGLAAGTVKT